MTATSTRTHVKQYPSREPADTALAHYRWLRALSTDVELPALISRTPTALRFEYIEGPTAQPRDLPAVAAALGRLHAGAYRHSLVSASTNVPFASADDVAIAGFAPSRRQRLHQALRAYTPESPLTHHDIARWLDHAGTRPAALYKDANPRNTIMNPERGPVLVDFDSLTLAPPGYDLAKLLVTTAMSFGLISPGIARSTLRIYNDEIDPLMGAITPTDLIAWSEFHHLLTRPYLGRNGYAHSWDTVRTWTNAETLDALTRVRS